MEISKSFRKRSDKKTPVRSAERVHPGLIRDGVQGSEERSGIAMSNSTKKRFLTVRRTAGPEIRLLNVRRKSGCNPENLRILSFSKIAEIISF